jgi:hypothetical protein
MTPDRKSAGPEGEETMSRFNGDKARFNRVRRQNIQRRKRNRALFQALGASPKSAAKPAQSVSSKGPAS